MSWVPPVSLPDEVATLAQEYASGLREPVEPRAAATVVLLRSGAEGVPEVYLLRRQRSMQFAGGMCVFPGGGVDERDHDHAVAWAGPEPAEWASRLRTDTESARALVCAAVRETFEEAGVLLAGDSPDTVVADTTGAEWEADREALESRELAFTDFLDRRGLVLRSDLLGVWSGWLTPEFEPKRYETWFFLAQLPDGQVTRDVSGESSAVTWLPAGQAVAGADRGELAMLPPTYLTCLEIDRIGALSAVLDAGQQRAVSMFMPRPEPAPDGWRLTVPDWMRTPLAEHVAVRGGSA